MARISTSFFSSLIILSASSVFTTAHADSTQGWEVGVGFENFSWKESISGVALVPKESGNRLALHVGRTLKMNKGEPYWVYAGKLYSGSVNYETATMVGYIPTSTTTDYLGMVNEVKGVLPVGPIELVAGLGYDYWSRSIADGLTNTGASVAGYKEDWNILFSKFGISANLFEIADLAVGVKYTIQNNESGLGASGHPGQSSSPYFDVSFRVSPDLNLAIYLDTYDFKKSVATSSGLYQPSSKMTALGCKVGWNF